jgi:hypothetical protein
VSIRAYSDETQTEVIDTATGYPANNGNIAPDERAHFEAVFFNLTSWDQVKAPQYIITWSNITAH